MKKIYLDDVRTPMDSDWVVVRDFTQFCDAVSAIGITNIDVISLDHDLGPSAMSEYFNNVALNYKLDYNNISELTGYDCAKWLVQYWYDTSTGAHSHFPKVYTHSANPIGSANIMGYINNFFMNNGRPQTCVRVQIPHTIKEN